MGRDGVVQCVVDKQCFPIGNDKLSCWIAFNGKLQADAAVTVDQGRIRHDDKVLLILVNHGDAHVQR